MLLILLWSARLKMKKLMKFLILITIVVNEISARNVLSREEQPADDINPNPDHILPPDAERSLNDPTLFWRDESEISNNDVPLEKQEGINISPDMLIPGVSQLDHNLDQSVNNINPNPHNILPPDAERSLNDPSLIIIGQDESERSINVPSEIQEGLNSSPDLLVPRPSQMDQHLDPIQQSQLVLSPGIIEGADNVNPRVMNVLENTERKLAAIKQKCLESHEHFIVFPGEPRPIICDSNGSDTGRQESSTAKPNNYENCMKSCRIGALNNPVCGTNFITYFNFDQITCARKCGVDVLLLYDGECGRSTSAPPPTPTSTPFVPTSTTPDPIMFEQCVHRCLSATPEYYPVCGSDFVTYPNPSRLLCAKNCGRDVTEVRKGRCPTRVPTATLRPTPRPVISTTMSSVIKSCISQCVVTSEYNPVCGSDSVTYVNPARLHCAKLCGVEVSIINQGRCGGS